MPYTVSVLEDLTRLPEIYRLRVLSYEDSPKSVYINRSVFPNGWQDTLDAKAIHWVATTSHGNIAGAARLAVLNNLAETGEDLSMFGLPATRPFAYLSRLVIHPHHKGLGISRLLDMARLQYIADHSIGFALVCVFPDRLPQLLGLGFRELGMINFSWGGTGLPTIRQHVLIFHPASTAAS